MRSWLTSPVIAAIALVASLITIGQGIVSVTKWMRDLMRDQDQHRRASIVIVAVCFAAIAVISPLTWSAIATAAAKAHDSHWMAMTYPIEFDGLALVGALMLLEDLKDRRRFSRWPLHGVIIGLAGAVSVYLSGGNPGIGLFVNAMPAVTIGFLAFAAIARAGRAAKFKAVKPALKGARPPKGRALA